MHKIKAIATLVNSKKKLYTCFSNGAQWIGTGQAMYPISNLPLMDINQFAKLLDIPSDKKTRSKYFFKELDNELFDFVGADASTAKPLYINRWSFFRGTTEYIPLCTTKGLMFLESDWLKPILKTDMCEICEACNSDQDYSYIIVKEGMFVVAMLEPYSHVLDENVTKELYSMLASLQVGKYAKRAAWYVENTPGFPEEAERVEALIGKDPDQLMLGDGRNLNENDTKGDEAI